MVACRLRSPEGDQVSRWLKRNAWALPVAVAVLALASFNDVQDWLDGYRTSNPVSPVSPGADGWVRYGTARVRLIRIEQVEPVDYGKAPLALPPGTTAWRAELEFDLPTADALNGCQVRLRSGSGWVYTNNPTELSGAKDKDYVVCGPSGADSGSFPRGHRGFGMFLMPATEQPRAVEITRATLLPRYAELPRGTARAQD
jgi:hypothetical protein